YNVPILIRRVKGADEKSNFEEDDSKANFTEYVFILVKNLPSDYCIKKPDADNYSKLDKDMGKLNNVVIKPKKDIYDYLNEMPLKKNVSFRNITIDNVEPRCSAFLEQELKGEFYNPISDKTEEIKGRYTQFQKIVINKGKVYRIIAVVLPRDELEGMVFAEYEGHKLIQDEIKFIMNSFKIIESDYSTPQTPVAEPPSEVSHGTQRIKKLLGIPGSQN
ncbi:MAG: hypothetical protein LLF83_03905, partial [Methanobacterium sp.]|nr:hypothetical protein [Methanobacterium sp.]